MKMPNKYVGKRLCDIDSHDLCIDLIKVHKRKKSCWNNRHNDGREMRNTNDCATCWWNV